MVEVILEAVAIRETVHQVAAPHHTVLQVAAVHPPEEEDRF